MARRSNYQRSVELNVYHADKQGPRQDLRIGSIHHHAVRQVYEIAKSVPVFAQSLVRPALIETHRHLRSPPKLRLF